MSFALIEVTGVGASKPGVEMRDAVTSTVSVPVVEACCAIAAVAAQIETDASSIALVSFPVIAFPLLVSGQ